MEYRAFKNDGWQVSLLGFGAMRLPVVQGQRDQIDYDAAKRMVDAAWAAGVNYFDTAFPYHQGTSEGFLAKALAEYPREDYYLADKMPVWLLEKEGDAQEKFDEQLKRCNTDYFDVYLLHAMDAESFEKAERLKLWDFAQEMRRQGKIRRIGFSFHDSPEVLERVCSAHPWDVVQLQMNYLDWENQRAKEQYEVLQKYGIPCIVMEPVRGGRLADLGEEGNGILRDARPKLSVASWALRWVAALPGVLTVLSGMSTLDQVEDNLGTFAEFAPLSAVEEATLQSAVEAFRKHSIIACSACRYCMPCPAGVDIPGLLSLRNECAFDSNAASFVGRYKMFPQGQNASHCVACGACEEACPQHLPVISLMEAINRDVAGKMD